MDIINTFLSLPLQTQIVIALIIATVIVLGSFLFGFIEDIIILALGIIAFIFLFDLLWPVISTWI